MRKEQIKQYVNETVKGPFTNRVAFPEFIKTLIPEEWDYLMQLVKEKEQYFENHPDEMPEIKVG
ncbi:MAG: hypothetical protein ACFN0Y_02660 [Lactobacillus sp.]